MTIWRNPVWGPHALYWFHAHRAEPKLNGIKLGKTERLTPAERMGHYKWVYRFEASKLEAVGIDEWLDLKKIERYLHNKLGRRYQRLNGSVRPAEVFDLGADPWEEAVKFLKWEIDDLMTYIQPSGVQDGWTQIADD